LVPIVVTELGIITEVNPDPVKHEFPISVIEVGIVIEVNDEQL